MFQLQLQYHKQSDWENTVYKPVDYARALYLLKQYTTAWGNVHNYRIVPTGASK